MRSMPCGTYLTNQKQDFGRRYSYISNTELDDLGDQLNYTVEKLEQTIRQEYILTIKQKESEFKALQSQIQPHFLFNTLNNMSALNQIGDQRTRRTLSMGLSGMLLLHLKSAIHHSTGPGNPIREGLLCPAEAAF